MKITNYRQLPENKEICCTKTDIRQLTDTEDFDIKLFEMQPGGASPLHCHPDQHRILILEGEGTVSDGGKTSPIRSEDTVSTQANEPHQFKNTSDKPLRFLAVTFRHNK